jgi:predicted alpha/beta-fold hydrolase
LAPEFHAIFNNPHLLTIAGNFWPREIDVKRFPAKRTLYQVDPSNAVIAIEHQPSSTRGQIVLVHGLEGSAGAGYIASFSQLALERGFAVHRLNLRTCGGTEDLCETMYHSGLTDDTKHVLQAIRSQYHQPTFLVGFSLGGNMALKLVGELAQTDLLAGACSVSAPIDLAACVRTLDKRSNILYARRFLARLRARIRRKSKLTPHLYSEEGLESVKTIWEFDDRFTAPLFGFGTAANYYATQSAINFLDAIRVPTLIIHAQDDPLVPFDMYRHTAFQTNPALTLVAPRRGGHIGFLSRRKPRFWVDSVILDWIDSLLSSRLAGDWSVQEALGKRS